MGKNFFFGLFIILLLGACKTPQGLKKENNKKAFALEIEQILNLDSTFMQSHTGLVVRELNSDKDIINFKGSHYFTPASNTKLLTFYTSINVIGEKINGLRYVEKEDSLIIWGTGDPSFLNPSLAADSSIVKFLKSSDKPIYFSAQNFHDVHYGSGWSWDDFNYGYQTEKNSLPMFGNMVNFRKLLEVSDFEVHPSYFRILTIPSLAPQAPTIIRDEHQNLFRYDYYKIANIFNVNRNVPFKTDDKTIIQLLEFATNKNIEACDARLEGRDFRTMATAESDSLYKLLLQPSDNFVAEQLLLNCSSELFDTMNTRKVIEWAREQLLSEMPQDFQWVDGSGLSRYNMTTPENMVHLLKLIYKKVPQERLFYLLPTGGESGTIKNLYGAEQPFVYAKTGSLRNNHSLSGYLVGNSGKIYVFSFMNSNYLVSNNDLKSGMDRVLRILKENL